MTDEELKGIAAQSLNLAIKEIEETNRLGGIFASYFRGEGLRRMRKIEALLVELLGPEWLDDRAKKYAAFNVMREATILIPPDAMVFVSAVNAYQATDKMIALGEKEARRLTAEWPENRDQLLRDGLMSYHDCIMSLVQTRERFCTYTQEYDEDKNPLGAPKVFFGDQKEFDGNLKLYGERKRRKRG
jgi:hypothetical protein